MDATKSSLEKNTNEFLWPNVQAASQQFTFPPPLTKPTDTQQYWYSVANFWNPSRVPPNYPSSASGISRESSRDDLTSMELEHVFDFEERFRVDRRKLELLIMGQYEPIDGTAAEYFQKVGEDTNTTVIWPSRLKIGAKSKKDPHIRVGGLEEGVVLAKTMIMEHLDTKARRVTMKMDVSYTDHSHIIGKGGNTIRRVMNETGCHIHFPDSNRSNPNEKSNQVSIAGREMEGVEKARARVRELTPLIFTFDLPIMSSLDTVLDPNDPFLRTIQDQYNIQLTFRQKQKNFHTTMAVIKGCEWEAARVKEATLLLIDHLCGTGSSSTPTTPTGSAPGCFFGAGPQLIPVTMHMEISPVHHSVVVGKNNVNLKVIMQRTKTTILFPDAADPNIPQIRKGSVAITGAIHNVYSARQQLVGALPLVLMFDMPEGLEVNEPDYHKISEELDVSISIKPKHRQGSKSVLIKAQERNASAVYEARHRLLKLEDDEEELVKAEIPEAYKILPASSQLLSSLEGLAPKTNFPFDFPNPGNPASSLMFPQIGSTGFYGGANIPQAFSPYLLPPQNSWATAALNNPQAFANILTPNHPALQDYAWLVLNNITRLQHQQLLENQQNPKNQSMPQNGYENNNWLKENNGNQLGVSVPTKNGDSINSPPIQGASPRNSSPVQDTGNLTNNLSKLDLNGTCDKMMSMSGDDINDHSSSGLGTSVSTVEPDLNSTFGHLFPDRRAPGCEKKNLQMQQYRAQQQQNRNVDFDEKRLMATRAIQSKPTGEPRTPTPAWSGLGFSNSMPEHMIKEKMAVPEQTILPAEVTDDGEKVLFSGTNASPWFGNSSAFDALLNGSKLNNNQPPSNVGVILPTDDLPTVFTKEGLAKYTDLFVRHEVDLQTFATLTEQDLREIGVQTFGARKKLLLLANKVKQSLNKPW